MKCLKELDDLLRGRKTDLETLSKGTDHLSLKSYSIVAIVLGIVYGVFMGLFAVLNRTPACPQQLLATSIKVPLLFFLTLLVTFPSLYVFSALLGTKLGPGSTLRMIVAALTVNLAVLASFGTITGFFTLCTTNYHFMKLLNVLIFVIAGFIGLGFLLTILRRLETARMKAEPAKLPPAPLPPMPPPTQAPPVAGQPPSGQFPPPGQAPMVGLQPPPQQFRPYTPRVPRSAASKVFRVWVVIFALVGAQMGWVLRPFIGYPDAEFQWFRDRKANFFVDVFGALGKLVTGDDRLDDKETEGDKEEESKPGTR